MPIDKAIDNKMTNPIDVSELVDKLLRSNITPEDIIGRIVHNLYKVENRSAIRYDINNRNIIRSVVAHAKALYDIAQQMILAREYLLHRIKLLEVRENDLYSEINVLRGLTPPPPVAEDPSLDSVLELKQRSQSGDKESDAELEILMDTRMISEIDKSRAAFQDIGQRLADKKEVLLNLDKQMDMATSDINNSAAEQGSLILKDFDFINVDDQGIFSADNEKRAGRTQRRSEANRPRGRTPRIRNQSQTNMNMEDNEETLLPPQGFRSSSDRREGSMVLW